MLRLSFFFTYTTVLADFLATSLILLNRWTAIIMPVTYKKVWNKLILPSALAVFGIPTLLYIPILTVNCYLQNDTSSGATLISYRKHCKKDKGNKNNQQIHHEKTEYKLMVYAIATFVGHLIIVLEQLSTTIFTQPEYAAAVVTQYPWTMDLGSVVLPSCITIKFNAVQQATMVKPVNNVQNTAA
uniref:Serpentine receptor class gamma n=1 Tax=Meloidogyne javanica TaxID=6303 RepID=A0A915N436_MELJA